MDLVGYVLVTPRGELVKHRGRATVYTTPGRARAALKAMYQMWRNARVAKREVKIGQVYLHTLDVDPGEFGMSVEEAY